MSNDERDHRTFVEAVAGGAVKVIAIGIVILAALVSGLVWWLI